MRTTTCPPTDDFADVDLTSDPISLITDKTWESNVVQAEKNYKKFKTSEAFLAWKNLIDNTDIVKTLPDEKVPASLADRVELNIGYTNFALKHLKAIQNKKASAEVKVESLNQLPIIVELILAHSITEPLEQIKQLELYLKNLSVLKQQLINIKKEETRLKRETEQFIKASEAYFPFNLLNNFCLFHCNPIRRQIVKIPAEDKCLDNDPRCEQRMK